MTTLLLAPAPDADTKFRTESGASLGTRSSGNAEATGNAEARCAPIVDELTRRGVLAGGLSSAMFGLAACGSNRDAGSSSTPSRSTRSISTAKGQVRVPSNPKRVVTIQPSATSTLYDLGLTPVGVYDEGAQYISPRYLARWKAAPKIGSDQIDVEKVAALNPDLIIGVDYSWNTDVLPKLSKIAPTVIAPATTWQATAHTTADAVNRLHRLATLQKRVADLSAQIKSQYADVLARFRWDILQGGFDAGQFWLYGPKSDAGSILAAAGVQFASGSAAISGSDNQPLSYEKLDVLADAGVIGYYANFDGTPNNQGPQLFAQAGFQNLAAVRAGRTVPIPDFLPGGYGDALAILDELVAGLKKLGG